MIGVYQAGNSHPHLCSRRQMLLWIGATTGSLIGCRRRRSQPTVASGAPSLTAAAHGAALPSCLLRPEQTEGPYFVDEKLNRADLRVDPTDGSVRPGVPLRLQFNVSQISDGRCDAVSGANGTVQFNTIYPGWYEGRAVHIHFKIRTDSASRGREFTSQLYFDETVTDQVHQQSPYNRHGRRTILNNDDFSYRRGGKQLMPALSRDSQGYNAKFEIGLQLV